MRVSLYHHTLKKTYFQLHSSSDRTRQILGVFPAIGEQKDDMKCIPLQLSFLVTFQMRKYKTKINVFIQSLKVWL